MSEYIDAIAPDRGPRCPHDNPEGACGRYPCYTGPDRHMTACASGRHVINNCGPVACEVKPS